jgi:hypothetical protein
MLCLRTGSRTRFVRRGVPNTVRHEKHHVVLVCHGIFTERKTTTLGDAFKVEILEQRSALEIYWNRGT